MLKTTSIIAAALLISAPAIAQTTYTGADDGSSVGGAQVNSNAAAASFLGAAATYGTVSTINFDGSPDGDAASYSYPGLTITPTVVNSFYSGVQSRKEGNLYGYDQSAGGNGKWFGSLGDTTFTFDAPTNSFGFYTSGSQTVFGTDFTVTIDGVDYLAQVNTNGGSTFFGFTSATAFSSVLVSRPGSDAWGYDNISFSVANTGVPEPTTWALMILGMGAVGGAMRRRSATKTTVRFA